jgi:hypothetical protein
LVNKSGISIHHVASPARFCPAAFIFNERLAGMVNRWCVAATRRALHRVPGVNPMLNRVCLKLDE